MHKKILVDRNYALSLGRMIHVFGQLMLQDNLHYANGILQEIIVKMLSIKTLNNYRIHKLVVWILILYTILMGINAVYVEQFPVNR